FDTPEQLSIFLQSEQSKVTQNIILKGERWNYMAVNTILSVKCFPALNEIFLVNTPINQDELKNLINFYKNINFNIMTWETGYYWPSLVELQK
ncbi:MAG: hypothetical protein P8X42_11075, partial [Calditrichaceae bacterium]